MQSGKAGSGAERRWGREEVGTPPTYLHTIRCLARASPIELLGEGGENPARWDSSTSRVAQPSRPQGSPKAPRPTLPLRSLKRETGGRGEQLFAKPTPEYHDLPASLWRSEGPLVGRLGSPAKEGLRAEGRIC